MSGVAAQLPPEKSIVEQLEAIDDWNAIESHGGPLIFMASTALPAWEGGRPPSPPRVIVVAERVLEPGEPATDYHRACEIEGYLGVIDVGGNHALVIGDEPCSTILVPSLSGKSLIIAKWCCGPNVQSVVKAISGFNIRSFPPAEVRFEIKSSPQYLFDSVTGGDELGELTESLRSNLSTGWYIASTMNYCPGPEISLVLHWIRPETADES